MANNYSFLDAASSVQTAASSVVSGAHQQLVQIASVLTVIPTTFSGSPSISGAVTVVGNTSVSVVGSVPVKLFDAAGSILTTTLNGSDLALDINISQITAPATSPVGVVGPIASGATDSGNPVKIGGVFNTTQPSVSSGQRINAAFTSKGAQIIANGSEALTASVVQGTSPWVATNIGSIVSLNIGSIITTNVGSVITVLQSASIAGTYAEDSAHTTGDRGMFALGVRNDTVASFVGADLDYAPRASDSAGRVLTKPFAAEEARVEGYGSIVSTSQMTLVAAAGAGLRNYITDIWFANTDGANGTIVTLKDSAGSVLGYTIAPSKSGSNLPGLQVPIRTGVNASFDIQPATAVSILYATVKGFKAP